MSDLISRKDIIRAHKEYCEKHPEANWYKWSLSIMQTAPSVEKVGRWVEYENEVFEKRWKCSACKRFTFHNGAMLKKYIYCPNCGARMEAKP